MPPIRLRTRLLRLLKGRSTPELDQLRARVAQLESRARRRTRDDLRFVFVMTYGRSGSTLVQGLLNSIPGYLIRGENQNMVHCLYDFQRRGLRVKQRGGRRPTQPWFGAPGFPPQRSLEGIRALVLETVLRPKPGTRVAGFKEIRWRGPDLPEYVEFLRQVFPGARFIVNTRDLRAVSRSKWWAEDPDALEKLASTEARMLEVARSLGEDAYHLHYDDYVADPEVLRGLFEWLGEPWDAERVRDTLATRHSY